MGFQPKKPKQIEDWRRPPEVYKDIFAEEIDQFCIENNIENMATEPQNRWNACLMYINNNVFQNRDELKVLDKQNNKYDFNILNKIADYYIYYCSMYNKEINITGFCYLVGLDTEIFNDWSHNDRFRKAGTETLSNEGFTLHKRLTKAREDSLSNFLTSGKNPVGTIAILNHHFKWSSDQVRDETAARMSVTAADLSKKYGLELSENGAQIEDKNAK